MTAVLEAISIWAIPVVVALVAFYAICKKVPVYSVFGRIFLKQPNSTHIMRAFIIAHIFFMCNTVIHAFRLSAAFK